MIWFTADFHLSHKNIIKYCSRPFEDIIEMDEILINNLRGKINSGDTLYFLGDLTFDEAKAIQFFEDFKDIIIHFIIGNHDYSRIVKIAEDHCEGVSRLKDIVIEEQPITLCHYAMRVWHKSHFNSWQLYGHSHARVDPIGKQYDVGVDNNNFLPVSFEELIEIMNNQPNNFNYIPPEKRNRL